MASIVFINVQGSDTDVVAHGAGCQDIARTVKRSPFNEALSPENHDSERAAFLSYNCDFIGEDCWRDCAEGECECSAWPIKFFPCCNFEN